MGRHNAITLERHGPLLTATIFLLLILPPVLRVLAAGMPDTGGAVQLLRELMELLQRPAVYKSIQFSVIQAGISAAVSVLLCLPGAYLIAHIRFPGRKLVQSLTLLPFVLPSLIVILAIISLYGRSGLLGQLFGSDLPLVYSPFGIIVAHVMFNIAVAMRMISGGWQAIDDQLCDISRSLGEPFHKRLLHLDLPLLLPSILSALAVVFLYCLVSFGVVLIFGGVRFSTMEVRIYQEMFQNLNLQGAALLALIQIAVAAGTVFLLQFSISHSPRRRAGGIQLRPWRRLHPGKRLLSRTYWFGIAAIVFAPLASLIVRAFYANGSWNFATFAALLTGRSLGGRNLEAVMRAGFPQILTTSLGIALLSALLCTVAAYGAAWLLRGKRAPFNDTLLMLPLAISGVTLSLGMRLLWQGVFPTPLIIAACQAIMAFPMVFKVLRTALDDFPQNCSEAAQSVGAGRWFRFLTLDLPLLRRGLINGFVLAFALGLADFTAVLTIGRGGIVTFPVALYRLAGFQSFDAALALAVIYIIIVALVFRAIDATSSPRTKEQFL